MTSKGYYSELATAREPATVTCVWAETQRQVEEWDSFVAEKRKASGVLCWEAGETGDRLITASRVIGTGAYLALSGWKQG